MVMVSARLTRRWRLSYRHDLTAAALEAHAELALLRLEWEREAAAIRDEMRALLDQVREERKRERPFSVVP